MFLQPTSVVKLVKHIKVTRTTSNLKGLDARAADVWSFIAREESNRIVHSPHRGVQKMAERKADACQVRWRHLAPPPENSAN